MPHKISAVIPVHNRPNELERALVSVISQTRPPDEIIVVDDGSADDVGSVCLRVHPGIRLIRFPENRGVSAARNAGIAAASGDWIALLDSDDEWLPERLEMQLRYLAAHPELTILQSEEIWIRNGVRVNPMKKHRKYGGDIFLPSLPLCIVSPSAVLFRRSVFNDLGGFDEGLPVCEDYDLWLRWSLRYPFGLLDEPGIRKYGGHGDQLSRTTPAMDRYRIMSLRKLLTDPLLDEERAGHVRGEIRRKLEIYLGGLHKRGRPDPEFEALKNSLEGEDG